METLSILPEDLAALKLITTFRSNYHILDVKCSIHADQKEVLTLFDQMYRRFKTDGEDAACHFYVITSGSIFGYPFIIFDNKVQSIYGNELIYSHAYMVILNELINRIKNFFLFHAGVVSQGESGALIVGPSSFGKTTLILELVKRGFRFLSDEFCPIDRESKRISSFPRSLSIRKNSLNIINTISAKNLTPMKNIGRGEKLLMDIEDWKEGSVGTSAIGKYVFFLRGNKYSQIDDGERMMDLALKEKDEELISDLKKINDIEIISQEFVEVYMLYRFRFKKKNNLTLKFQEVCERHNKNILYTEAVSTDKPDFDREPFIEEISKSKATTS